MPHTCQPSVLRLALVPAYALAACGGGLVAWEAAAGPLHGWVSWLPMWSLPVSVVLSLAAGALLRDAADPLVRVHAGWQRRRALRGAMPGAAITLAALCLPDTATFGIPDRLLLASLGFAAALFFYPVFQALGLVCLALGRAPCRRAADGPQSGGWPAPDPPPTSRAHLSE
jgi:hypothetical protein